MSGLATGAMFAGYGGLDIAVEDVFGARPAWVAEVGRGPSRILAARYPDAPNLGDVTKVDWTAVEPVSILTGGTPCQDLSHAGKRAGMKPGTRSGLWASMCDAIEVLRPRFVVWENVRGALSAKADSAVEPCPLCVGEGNGVTLRALGRVLGDLAELGYDAAWTGLRAADIGAAHGRFRVFVLAWSTDAPTQSADLGYEWAGPSRDGRPGPPDGSSGAVALLPTPAVNDMGRAYTPEEWDSWTARMRTKHGNGNGHGKSLEIEAQRLLPTPRATDGTKGGPNQHGSSGDLMLPSAVLRFGPYAPAVARWGAVLGREAPEPTEPSGKGGARRLSPRFVEWLMGLEEGWVTGVGLTRNETLKALGNGVVPQQASAALRHLLTVRAAALTGPEESP